jgi:hypothetical protein
VFFTMVNSRRLVIGPNAALYIDKDLEHLQNVNALCSTLVGIYLAMLLLLRTILLANGIDELGLMRWTRI